jgi:hypothetical protein
LQPHNQPLFSKILLKQTGKTVQQIKRSDVLWTAVDTKFLYRPSKQIKDFQSDNFYPHRSSFRSSSEGVQTKPKYLRRKYRDVTSSDGGM